MSTHRIVKARQLLEREKIDLLIVDHPVDLYYLTGHHLSLGRLMIDAEKALLFVDGRYLESCRMDPDLNVVLTKGYGKESAFAKHYTQGLRVGFDASVTSYQSYLDLQTVFGASLVPLTSPIAQLRAIKEPVEIELLKAAAELGSDGFDFVRNKLCEGAIEEEVAAALEIFWRTSGGQKLAFEPIIAFGAMSALPHYRAAKQVLKAHEPLLIDIGVVRHHYHSDMTRVLFLGEPTKQMATIYQVVLEAMQAALSLCRAGTPIQALDSAARGVIGKAGYGDFFTHGLGHGVGLEIHEAPSLKGDGILSAGHVITIEPGIYLPGMGGVRLEDTIVISESGYASLTNRPLALDRCILPFS